MTRNLFLLMFLLVGCYNDSVIPKPNAFLYKEFEKPTYKIYKSNCGYSFQTNDTSTISSDECNLKINNKKLKATIFITYIKIDNNLNLIESDFNEKMNENSKNAFFVKSSEYVSEENNIFAKYFSFSGDTPSNTHFFLTDSVSFYFSGSLFFDSKPHYDSLIPSINYMNQDIRKLIQSFSWN